MNVLHAQLHDHPFSGKDIPGPLEAGVPVIDAPTLVHDDAGPALLVGNIPERARDYAEKLRAWLTNYRGWNDKVGGAVSSVARLSGIAAENATFGYVEPSPLRRRYGCAASTFLLRYPVVSQVLAHIAAECWNVTGRVAPELVRRHGHAIQGVKDDWLMGPRAPFTSGIINNNAALPYHCDSGNIKDSLSLMLCIRQGVGGGMLHLPGWDMALRCADLTFAVFDGQGTLHGVTPLEARHGVSGASARRWTVVYYAKRQFAKAGTYDEEVTRAQARATEASARQRAELRARATESPTEDGAPPE